MQPPFDILSLPSPEAPWDGIEEFSNHNSYFHGADVGAYVLRRPRLQQPTAAKSVTWAVLVSVVAILAVLARCFGSTSIRTGPGNAERRLVDGDQEGEEDHEQSRIIEECLELQEEMGHSQASSTPLQERGEVVSQLVESMIRYQQALESLQASRHWNTPRQSPLQAAFPLLRGWMSRSLKR